MRRPDEVKRDFVRQWLRKAEQDLATAEHLLEVRIELGFSIGFHSQQAAEKYLKALLVWRQIEFPKTHDLERLMQIVESVVPHCRDSLASAAGLSAYAVDARYPGDLPEPTAGEARQAVRSAREVRSWVYQELPDEARGGAYEPIVQPTGVEALWNSRDPREWSRAVERYWEAVQPRNLELERAMDALHLDRIRSMNEGDWYRFLLDEYFRWKYTQPNRYATTTRYLRKYEEERRLQDLHEIKERLLNIDVEDVASSMRVVLEIKGLGASGASGLLAVTYPRWFGTADQFVVAALARISNLPERESILRMDPEGLTPRDAAILIEVMRRKAAENNRLFVTDAWTPRKIDMVLWACR